jgi:hypothetical protein
MDPQPVLPTTFDQHLDLLADKGFLEGNFGNAAKIGQWVIEFRERFERAQFDGVTTRKNQDVGIVTTGTFNDSLEKVIFTLGYQYNPRKDVLALLTLTTSLGGTTRTYFLNGRNQPPTPHEAYKKLVRRQGNKHSHLLIEQVRREQDQAKHPAYDPYLDMSHPRFNQVNDLHKDQEFSERPPTDLTSFRNRPSRR